MGAVKRTRKIYTQKSRGGTVSWLPPLPVRPWEIPDDALRYAATYLPFSIL